MTPSRKPSKPNAKSRATTPSEFAPGVFVGGWSDALRFQGARFCVLDEAPEDMPPATHIRIYDDSADRPIRENLDELARVMSSARSTGTPVLVFCGHGVRRSPLGAAWYLHRAEGLPLKDAYARIRAVRPKVEEAREWIGHADELERA